MTDYVIESGSTLYNTQKTQRNQLLYERSPGVNWRINEVDYTTLAALTQACDGADVPSGTNSLKDRIEEAADDAMHRWLNANGGDPALWHSLANHSQPSNGTWSVQTTSHWVHIVYDDPEDGEGIAVALSSSADGSDTTDTFRVPEMEVVASS